MAYVALPARAAGDPFDINLYNQIRDNDAATGPAIVTTKGDLVVATAANTLARLGVGADGARFVADSTTATGTAWKILPACRVYNDADIDPATAVALSGIDIARYQSPKCSPQNETDTVHDVRSPFVSFRSAGCSSSGKSCIPM